MMENKKTYMAPRVEVIAFNAKDIITTSGEGGFFGDEDPVVNLAVFG